MSLQWLQRGSTSSVNGLDFDTLVRENLPNWNATWSLLLQANLERSKAKRRAEKRTSIPSDLHEKIWQKIAELVDEEEALIDLYTKAAEVAKEKEMRFRNKTTILMEQLKRDKNLMEIFRQAD